jgi:hypothetical protein
MLEQYTKRFQDIQFNEKIDKSRGKSKRTNPHFILPNLNWRRRNLHLQRRKGSTTKSWVSNCTKWKHRHENDLMSARQCILFLKKKTWYPVQGPTNPKGSIPPPTCGGPFKTRVFCPIWTNPPKLAPEGIKPEILRGTHSKVGKPTPLGQLKWVHFILFSIMFHASLN